MFGNDRRKLRQVFAEAWRRHQDQAPLDAMAQIIVAVVAQHPEYHDLLTDADSLDRDWSIDDGETNPFLHLSLHLSLVEQLQTDRPAGIRTVYQRLSARLGDPHLAEHRMMDCLGAALWQAQRSGGVPPDEREYLACLEKLLAVRER